MNFDAPFVLYKRKCNPCESSGHPQVLAWTCPRHDTSARQIVATSECEAINCLSEGSQEIRMKTRKRNHHVSECEEQNTQCNTSWHKGERTADIGQTYLLIYVTRPGERLLRFLSEILFGFWWWESIIITLGYEVCIHLVSLAGLSFNLKSSRD